MNLTGASTSNGSPVYTGAAFNAGNFSTALTSWVGNQPDVPTALAQAHMEARFDGSWTVSFSGSPIMDSRTTAGLPLWPGCLRGTPNCDWTNPLIDSLNKTFRWCAPPAQSNSNSLIRSSLGQCDGGNADAEANSLRWRVAGTLWLAAMMSGGVHDGMFTWQVPSRTTPP